MSRPFRNRSTNGISLERNAESSEIADLSAANMSNEFGVPPLGGRHFVDNYFTSDFDKWSSALLAAPVVQPPLSGRLYTEKNFWAQFLNDIKTVNKRLIILSPFLSTRRSGIFMNYLESMVRLGMDVRVNYAAVKV